MGKVRTTEYLHITGIYEPAESIVDYTYCDKCGSFNIDLGYPHRPIDNALTIIIGLSFVTALVIGLLTRSLAVCVGFGVVSFIAFLISDWGKHMRCNTCGNEKITSDNVLNFSGDNLNIDVPDGAIVKNYIKTVVY